VSCFIGLMSGTSLDGISAAAVRFAEGEDGRPRATLLHFTQRSYPTAARARLEAAMHGATAQEYCRLHADLGDWLADAALDVMRAAQLRPDDITAIASHGQTLWHEPGHSTWQVGDPARLAERTGCAVVADFRTRDMAVGGQGAPLVPMADRLLFAEQGAWRALQNIGGIGNVSVVPPAPTLTRESRDVPDERVRAFDTGPGVVIIDGTMRRLFGQPYDRDGAIAASGHYREAVLREYLELPFLKEPPPKSTGRELFTPAFIDAFVARCTADGATPADVVATATAFTAATIADQYTRFISEPIADVVVSGGGAHNPTLMRTLEAAFAFHHERFGRPNIAVRRFDDVFFDAEAKEAVAFALLGYLHLTGRAGNVPSATGARAPRVLGSYTPAARDGVTPASSGVSHA